MKAVNRILQALTVLGAIAAGVFYFMDQSRAPGESPSVKTLNSSLKVEREKIDALENQAQEQAEALANQDLELKRLSADSLLANNQLLQIQRENKRLKDEREAQGIAERRLQKENSRLTQELNVLQATTVSQDAVEGYEQTIAQLERQVLDLQQTQIPDSPIVLPNGVPQDPSLKGNILTVGKGASFVVLDIGYSDGVRLKNELLIQHADTPIAKIQVTEVKENLSIARVLPESMVKTPQTGDSVASLN